VTRDDDAAFADYAKSLDAARDAGLPALTVRIEVNRADLLLRQGQARLAQQALERATEVLRPLPASAEKVQLASAAASRMLEVAAASPKEADLDAARRLLAAAATEAQNLGDLRGQAAVFGESSQLEWRSKHGERALKDVRRAIFCAQAAQAPELLYQWEWQEGRLNAEQGRADEALADYRRAIATLQPIRHDLLLELRASGRSYRDTVGPLFLDYSDLLLKRAAGADDEASQRSLIDAREAIEQLKIVELEDYFHDDCTARFQERQKSIDRLPAGTAVIYPIILPDRLELLLSYGGRMRRFSVAVSDQALSDEALRFRKFLIKRNTDQYLSSAQRLYGWLIQPLQASLRADGVDTLVIVPDGPLLGIPFAALHDGQDFLIRSYAIGTVPGLHLIEPIGTAPVHPRALVAGLSAAVQGFPALPGVEDELRDVSQLYQAELLDNQSFTESNVEQAEDKSSFNLVHIASHGTFESEASKSFLLTYDGKLGMDSLERIIRSGKAGEDALDLLTLSACETAAGDERAALGLAGVAIKAGARSVVATLWNINDEAASSLVRDFYRELHHDSGSKAKALRAAQLRLLDDPRYRHPGYWAPFLLIGHWT
jgi:CHAT domain-containing protein